MNRQFLSHSYFVFCRQLLPATAILVVLSATVVANPRSDFPDTPLPAHGTIKGAEEEVKQLYALCAAEQVTAVKLSKMAPTALSNGPISASSGKLWMASRQSRYLKLKGEPAAHDLERRILVLFHQFHSLAGDFIGTPKGVQYKQKLLIELRKRQPARAKQLQKIQQMISQGKLEQAETELSALAGDVWSQVVFLSVSERRPFYDPIRKTGAVLESQLTQLRSAQHQQEATALVSQLVRESRKFQGEAVRVRGEISSKGTAALADDKQGDVVDAFAYVAGQWSKSHVLLMRCHAILWAFPDKTSPASAADPNSGPAGQAVKALSDLAKKELGLLIEAAAESTPSDKITTTYVRLLEQISIVNRRTAGEGITASCQAALKRLASKNEPLASQVEAYDRATVEPMRWRAKFAAMQAGDLAKNYRLIESHMKSTSLVTKSNRPPYSKLPTTERLITPAMFNEPANWMVYEAAGLLLEKNVSDTTMVRLTPSSLTAVVPYIVGKSVDRGQYGSHYANVPVPIPVDDQLAELRRFLNVDATHPPLSIAAADAISAAELQDFETVGGMVARLHLEATVTRFAKLPEVAYVLHPLGKLPTLTNQSDPVTQTCWRFDVVPHWAQHKYFVVQPVAAAQ